MRHLRHALASLLPFLAHDGANGRQPIHFSGRSRRLLNWSRLVSRFD